MNKLDQLISEVENARQAFIQEISGLSAPQAQFKPAPEVWSICEITEHIVWAERIGVNRMWQAVEGYKKGQPVWEGRPSHEGQSIEKIIGETWQPKEKVPEVAKPIWGGPLAFWLRSLEACQPVLAHLEQALTGLDLTQIIYPHPISGPMNMVQRIEFLRFHLDRHRQQLKNVKLTPGYPNE